MRESDGVPFLYRLLFVSLSLINVRKNLVPFQRRELLAEELGVAFVDGLGARDDVGHAPEEEHRAGHRPGEQGEAGPFQNLAEVVGGADFMEHPAVGDIVVVVGDIAAKIADHAVGVQVHDHPEQEQRSAEDELRRPEPGNRVVVGRREEEEPAALHDGVERVEQRPRDDDGNRHLALPLHQQRKDERSLEVVELKEDEHHAGDDVERFYIETQ